MYLVSFSWYLVHWSKFDCNKIDLFENILVLLSAIASVPVHRTFLLPLVLWETLIDVKGAFNTNMFRFIFPTVFLCSAGLSGMVQATSVMLLIFKKMVMNSSFVFVVAMHGDY